jgi:hypothetical protein
MVWGACDKITKLISACTTAAAKLAHNQRWNFNPDKAFQSNYQISIGAGRQWLRPHLSSHPSIGRLFAATYICHERATRIYVNIQIACGIVYAMAHTHGLYLHQAMLLSGLEYICTTAEAEDQSEFTMFAFWVTPHWREKVPLKIKQSQFQPNEMARRSPMCQWARNKIESVHFGSTSRPKTRNHCRGVPCLVIDGANFLAKPIKIANQCVVYQINILVPGRAL